tara:strand:+ start:593 stop:1792 length:1200 start_codon:yes stop_codon:yes gene_type:complete
MKVLLLSFYFRPDLCAGSFRNTALVDSMKRKLPAGSHIDVITTLPNRYASFDVEAPEDELMEGVRVRRVSLPVHESGMMDQSRSFFIYALAVRKLVAKENYDVVVASSSRLMTAALGAWVARRKHIPLYLDIRDIFVDTIKDVLPRSMAPLVKVFFSRVERWTLSRANRLNAVSAGFLPYLEERYSEVSKVVFTNGIDDEFLPCPAEEKIIHKNSAASEDSIVEVLYAGNMGEGQGLHNIIPSLAKRLEGRVKFRLIGGGGRKEHLEEAVRMAGCSNVLIAQPVSRNELIDAYHKADVLFLHLNDYPAFRKVLPSKLFEYGALGKPIWAGVAGYSAEFIAKELDNVALFSPCDSEGAIQAFENLLIADLPRSSFVEKFSRRKIMDDMVDDLLDLLGVKV